MPDAGTMSQSEIAIVAEISEFSSVCPAMWSIILKKCWLWGHYGESSLVFTIGRISVKR